MHATSFDFYGDGIKLNIEFPVSDKITPGDTINELQVKQYFDAINTTDYHGVVSALLQYKKLYNMDDWLYYHLIRKTVQSFSPKKDNYERYTVYKYFLLTKSGYGATLKVGNGRLMFYVQTDEDIFNLPCYIRYGKQYVCLNYHDYKIESKQNEILTEMSFAIDEGKKPFTYKVTNLPGFNTSDYVDKEINFKFYQQDYQFKVKLNDQVKNIFANYPVVCYEDFFNIPLSKETYESLIPLLKNNVKRMHIKSGIDFLMRFTRYAFLYETDTKMFGEEKRLSPEQTLLYSKSDCEDRAALFFCLVKEIYNLPMIVLAYPNHVTIAVKLAEPTGKPIFYNGEKYTLTEPTPQADDLNIGTTVPTLKNIPYEIVYAYYPKQQ